MENLEEVLQALDEFQKMRPTEIPRELEDYLCWVAKTGDPIYQWPMIKTLFREKLTRVMTDFYESCPSLELAPCPNVEHFNYDTMKTTLLDRLESFANAPFTVQRICELLTAPRKEYNRVDKFMRAIEKNILVVSTREPGPIARRGETGDGMVNGSIEEDTASVTQQQQQQPPPPSPPASPSSSLSSSLSSSPSHPPQSQAAQSIQPTPQDVEMEYWEKDCSSTVTISVHTVENETPLLHTVVSGTGTGALAKNALFNTREKLEQVAPKTDQLATSNFIAATSDFSAISNLTAQVEQVHEPISSGGSAIPIAQSLPTSVAMIPEDSSVVVTGDDVAEAVTSGDTGTQSSTLDMESEEVQAATTTSTTTTTLAVAATAVPTITSSTSAAMASTTTMMTTTATTTMTTTATTTMTTTATTMMTTTATTSMTTAITSSTSAATTTVTVVATVIPLTTDTTRKLQAAFQAKRFEPGDNKCPDKPDEKAPGSSAALGDSEEAGVYPAKNEEISSSKLDTKCTNSNEISHNEGTLTEDTLKLNVDMRSDVPADDAKVNEERISQNKSEMKEGSTHEDMNEESPCSKSCMDDVKTIFVESPGGNENGAVASHDCVSTIIVSNGEALHRTERLETHRKGTSCAAISFKGSSAHEQPASRKTDNIEMMDAVLESIPRIASPEGDDDAREMQNAEFNMAGTKIVDVSEDRTSLGESVISDPTRIAEQQTGKSAIAANENSVSTIVETANTSNDSFPNIICRSPKDNEKVMRVEDEDAVNADAQNDRVMACIAAVTTGKQSVIESAISRREHEPMEIMEMDEEETASTYQQDEQMDTMEELPRS